MKSAAVLLLALAHTATANTEIASPVSRIVKLLTAMKETVSDDGKAEQQMYDKFACWCENKSKEKASNIAVGQSDIRALGQRILKLKGKVATLTSEIKDLNAKIKGIREDQEEATGIRERENKAWMSESATTKEALESLQRAIKLIVDSTSKAGASLLQETQGMQSRSAVAKVLDAMPSDLPNEAAVTSQQLNLLSEFAKGESAYAPQSATITGILGDMYSTFSTDLETDTATEADQNAKFEQLFASLEEEKNKLETSRDQKDKEKAEAEAMLADTTKAYDDTDKQLAADIAFFDSTKAACESKHAEWTVRKEMRAQELAGIDKALEILTSDENRVLFGKSIKPGVSFLQTGSSPSSLLQSGAAAQAAQAYTTLRQQVRRTHSLRLARLAVSVRTATAGHFDEVVKSIDDMMDAVNKEGQADKDKKNQCLEEYQASTRKVNKLDWLIENNLGQIAKFDKLIELRTKEKETNVEKIAQTKEYIKEATADRKAEHEEFQKAKKDDETAINVLTKARDAMAKYYKKNDIKTGPIQGSVKFIQNGEPVFDRGDAAPDASFSNKGSHKGEAKGILTLFAYIMEDLHDEISEAKKAEAQAHADYEEQMKAAEALVDDLDKQKTTLEGIIAKRLEQKEEENKDMKDNNKDRDAVLAYKAEIRPDCDWLLQSFDQRADARAQEMSGLTTAKEFLLGQQAFVQKSAPVRGGTSSSMRFLHAH